MNYECEVIDGVKIKPLLPKKWLMKKALCGNRTVTRKCSIEGFTFVQWA